MSEFTLPWPTPILFERPRARIRAFVEAVHLDLDEGVVVVDDGYEGRDFFIRDVLVLDESRLVFITPAGDTITIRPAP